MIHHHRTDECDGNGQCHENCHARQIAERFRADRGLAQRLVSEAHAGQRKLPQPPKTDKCIHLGEPTGEKVLCQSCKGKVEIKLQACAVHGKCSLLKPLPGVACCVGCNDRSPKEPLAVNHGAGGLGDALLGACAIKGLAKLHAGRTIWYKTGGNTQAFLSLFDLGENVVLGIHDLDDGNGVVGNPHPAADLQINTGYGAEFQEKGKSGRIQRYCRNLGDVVPELPKLKNPETLRARGRDFANAVVLAPFSSGKLREWPIRHWLTLERLLLAARYRVVVLGRKDDRLPPGLAFASNMVLGAGAVRVAGIVLASSMLIGSESGLAHLGGIMGKPTLVLCGPTTGEEIYGFYGRHMAYLLGHLDCAGCWAFPPSCEPTCQNLASISPQEVLEAVRRTITSVPSSAEARHPSTTHSLPRSP